MSSMHIVLGYGYSKHYCNKHVGVGKKGLASRRLLAWRDGLLRFVGVRHLQGWWVAWFNNHDMTSSSYDFGEMGGLESD
jgi:hypothetical protein